MDRSDRPEYGSVSSDTETEDDSSDIGRRRLLGGMAGGIAAPVVADAALPTDGLLDSVAATGRDPTEDWTSSPTDGEINALLSRDGFLIANTPQGLVSVDQQNGSRLWKYSKSSQGARSTIYDGSPYVVDSGTLTALDAAGNERWSVSYDGGVSLEVPREGALYVKGGSTLQALSADDGSTLWSVEPETLEDVENVTENLVLTTEGDSNTEIVAAYDRSDGSEVWRTEVATDVYLTTTSFGEKRVYYGYGSTVDALSVSDGSVLWSREFQDGLPFVFELGGTAYLFEEGKLAELSSADGSEVWALEFDGFPFPTDILGAEATDPTGLLVATESTVQEISLDGTRQWSFDVEDTENFSRAIAVGDLVYATDGDTLYELDAGEAAWSYENEGDTLATVVADGDRVYTNDTGTIYAFKHGAEDVGGGETTTAGGGGGTTTAGGGGETTTAGGGGGTTTAGGGGETTTAGGGGGTTAVTATEAPSDGTTAAMTEATAGDGTATEGDSTADDDGGDGDDDDSDDGQTPGFGVLMAVAAALLAALRLLGGDDDAED